MSWADQVTEESGTLRAQNLGAAAPDGLSITILPGSRRLTAEGGKVRPWTVDNVARISEMAEAYLGQGGE